MSIEARRGHWIGLELELQVVGSWNMPGKLSRGPLPEQYMLLTAESLLLPRLIPEKLKQ